MKSPRTIIGQGTTIGTRLAKTPGHRVLAGDVHEEAQRERQDAREVADDLDDEEERREPAAPAP